MDQQGKDQDLLRMTTEIVSAYTSTNKVATSDLPVLVSGVFQALRAAGGEGKQEPAEVLTPAVPVKRSVTPDFLVCLEDGRKVRMLKRHLAARYGLTPEQYRQRWGLAPDYPMVAPSYAARRSALAKASGLGRKPTAAATVAPPPPAPAEPVPAEAKAPRRRRAAGRRKAA